MESSPSTRWLKKRKRQSRMELVRAAKFSKASGEPSSTLSATPPSLDTPHDASLLFSGAEGSRAERPEPLSSLDESFSLRLNAHTFRR